MAKSTFKDTKRIELTSQLIEYFRAQGEDAMTIKGNVLAFPTVINGEDEWIEITIKVPSGSRDGEPYDGYSLHEDYELKLAKKARDDKENAEKKANKIARDKARREKAKEIAAKRDTK